jgi:hypothetical protein
LLFRRHSSRNAARQSRNGTSFPQSHHACRWRNGRGSDVGGGAIEVVQDAGGGLLPLEAPVDSYDDLPVSSLLKRHPRRKVGWILIGLRLTPGHEGVEAKVWPVGFVAALRLFRCGRVAHSGLRLG